MSLKREFKLLRKTLGRAWRDEKMRGLPTVPTEPKKCGFNEGPHEPEKRPHAGRAENCIVLRKFGARPSCDITHLQSAEADPFFEAPHYDYCYRCETLEPHQWNKSTGYIIETGRPKTGGEFFLPISPGIEIRLIVFFPLQRFMRFLLPFASIFVSKIDLYRELGKESQKI
jgi:hypothetical protein